MGGPRLLGGVGWAVAGTQRPSGSVGGGGGGALSSVKCCCRHCSARGRGCTSKSKFPVERGHWESASWRQTLVGGPLWKARAPGLSTVPMRTWQRRGWGPPNAAPIVGRGGSGTRPGDPSVCSQRHRGARTHTCTHTCTRTHTGANLGQGSSPWVHSAHHTCLTCELAADGERPS